MVNERPTSGQLPGVTRYARQDIKSVEPPLLENYRDAPIYDHTLIMRLVAVRPLALWALEQHIGLSTGARGAAEQGGQKRRYSERDLVALLWLRERVVEGESPQDAGARLIAAQRLRNSGALNSGSLPQSGALGGGGVTGSLGGAQLAPGPRSGALGGGGNNTPYPGYPPQPGYAPAAPSGPLPFGEYPSGALPPMRERQIGGTGGLGGSMYGSNATNSPDARSGEYPSGSWTDTAQPYTNPSRPRNPSRPLTERGDFAATPPSSGGMSGRLGSIYSAPMPITRPSNGFDAARDQNLARELRWLISPLMQAFSRFDTIGANRLVQQALEQYSVEVVCLGLVQPTIARVSELWSKSELTVPEERFAFSYLRGFLTSVFHSTMELEGAPLIVVGCAQRDMTDLPALLLAVFWRRSGLRVIYLGADAGVDDLARQRWTVIPAIITLTMATSQRIRSVNSLAKQLRGLPSPRPELCYTGGFFAHNPDLQRKVNAIYLGDDPAAATTAVRRLLGMIF